MSSDVFIIAASRDADAATAIRQAVELAGIGSSYVQDALFGLDDSAALPDVDALLQAAGLSCPTACVYTSMRALFFAAASMLSGDVELSIVVGMEPGVSAAFVLASPEAVGRLNLLPRARIAARSLAGPERALRAAELNSSDVEIVKTGEHAAHLLCDLLDELDAKAARWGMVSTGETSMVVERI